jgi:hypothetical protein
MRKFLALGGYPGQEQRMGAFSANRSHALGVIANAGGAMSGSWASCAGKGKSGISLEAAGTYQSPLFSSEEHMDTWEF